MIPDCLLCLGQHDEEIHAATTRVRGWFRKQVSLGFKAAVSIDRKQSKRAKAAKTPWTNDPPKRWFKQNSRGTGEASA